MKTLKCNFCTKEIATDEQNKYLDVMLHLVTEHNEEVIDMTSMEVKT